MTERLSTECQKEHPKNVENSRCPGRNDCGCECHGRNTPSDAYINP